MNYYTIVTPEDGLPCTPEEAEEIQAELERSKDEEEHHGFTLDYEHGEAYLVAEENGAWNELPKKVLVKMGELVARANKPYLEFGAAFTAGRLIPGSHGGTAFRIMADGKVVEREERWPRA